MDAHDALEVLSPRLDPWLCFAVGAVSACVMVVRWSRFRLVGRAIGLGVVVGAVVLATRPTFEHDDDPNRIDVIDVFADARGFLLPSAPTAIAELHRPTRLRIRSHDRFGIFSLAGAIRIVVPGVERELVVLGHRPVDKPCDDRCPAPLVCSDGRCRHGVFDLARPWTAPTHLHFAFETYAHAPDSSDCNPPPPPLGPCEEGAYIFKNNGCAACHGGAAIGDASQPAVLGSSLEAWVQPLDVSEATARVRFVDVLARIEKHADPPYRLPQEQRKRIAMAIVYRDWFTTDRRPTFLDEYCH